MKWKKSAENAICSMIPTIWHSAKRKTVETVKGSVKSRDLGIKNKHVKHRQIIGQWNYPVNSKGRHMSLYVCQNP